MRPIALFSTAALTVSLAAAAALAPQDGRFDSHLKRLDGGVIGVVPQAVHDLAPTDALRVGWEAFQFRYGGSFIIRLDQRSGMPTLVAGQGIVWFEGQSLEKLTLAHLEERARLFLGEHADLLGGGAASLELDPAASGEPAPGRWQIVFRQVVDGVRVQNSRLELFVNDGKLMMFGATHWGTPRTNGNPTLDPAEAREALDGYVGARLAELQPDGEPQLTMVALQAEPGKPTAWAGARGAGLKHALLWRFAFRDGGGPAVWTGEVDAHDGTVRAFYDAAHYAAIEGGVFPANPSGDCDAGGCELADYPMPYADWTEAGQATAYADTVGGFSCADPIATFETQLNGPYVRVDDQCGPFSQTANCDGSLSFGLKSGENCVETPGVSPGNTAAARSGYYHVNRVMEVARFYNPSNPFLSSQVGLFSNWPQYCNASYGGGGIYVYQEGFGCNNSGEIEGIVVHEWGHGYDQNDGGGYDNTSEAYGDVVSLFASRDSCFGPGFFNDGRVCSGYGDTCFSCTGFRDMDYAKRQDNTPATPQDFVQGYCPSGTGPCGYEVHCEAYPIIESMYDLAVRDLPASGLDADTAWQVAERLWYTSRQGSSGDIYTCALPASDSCSAGTWYQRLRLADDDDANLANGTPHAAALYAAFDRHNIACGQPGDPENQSTSSCPALSAPALTVTETAFGTQLDWTAVPGAAEYVVRKSELGCNHGQVPLAVVSGSTSWTDVLADPGLNRSYQVEPIGANPACSGPVSNCETTPGGPRLQLNGHQILEVGPNVNHNGFPDPGETLQIPATLFNGGLLDATGVHGRLRTVDPTQGRAVEPTATWPAIPVSGEFESDVPYFELTLSESGLACGETVRLEVEMDADGAMTRTGGFAWTLGQVDRDYPSSGSVTIPPVHTTPVTSTIEVTDDKTIAELDVSVQINHWNNVELIVELSSPTGTTLRLHDSSTGSGNGLVTRYDLDSIPAGPGGMAVFDGESILGTWTLSVRDAVYGAPGNGSLQSWTLHVTPVGAFECEPLPCGEPAPTESPASLTVDRNWNGDGSFDLSFGWSPVGGVAGYHVLESPAAAFDTKVDLTGRTDGPTSLVVPGQLPGVEGLTLYRVHSVNSCSQESL